MSFAFGSQPASGRQEPAEPRLSHQQHNPTQSQHGHEQHSVTEGQRHDRIQLDTHANTATGSTAMAGPEEVGITTTQRMVAATWGSILTSLLVTPLDVVRVRLQSQTTSAPFPPNLSRFHAYGATFRALPPDLGVTACCRNVFWVGDNGQFCLAGTGSTPPASAIPADCAVEETSRRRFHSTFDGLKKIARHEGLLTLWRGLTPTLMMAIPGNVIYFSGYDWLRYSHLSPIQQMTSDAYAPLVAGSVARVAAGFVVSPIEMFRTRMQATAGGRAGTVFKDTLLGLHRMTQTQGYASLWRGLTLTMWRDVPFSGIYWWGYEAVRNQLTDARELRQGKTLDPARGLTTVRPAPADQDQSATFIDSFVAGAASGAIASFVTTPFDVGKTRQQVYRHAGDDATSVQAAREMAKAGRAVPEEMIMPRFLYHIFREEGFHGLFKGWIPRCLKVAPACAIMISSYELGKRWAKKINEQELARNTPAAV
ncbi:hypothetical protein DV736_g3270, partial [Chaetothyriales sp. CBS 134916]